MRNWTRHRYGVEDVIKTDNRIGLEKVDKEQALRKAESDKDAAILDGYGADIFPCRS